MDKVDWSHMLAFILVVSVHARASPSSAAANHTRV